MYVQIETWSAYQFFRRRHINKIEFQAGHKNRNAYLHFDFDASMFV